MDTSPLAPGEIRFCYSSSDPRMVYVAIGPGDRVNLTTGKPDKRVRDFHWMITGVLMPFDPAPSYLALQCPPDRDFPGVTIQILAQRVYNPPSRGYGEYRWDPVQGESLNTGGLPIDAGAKKALNAWRLVRITRGLVPPVGRRVGSGMFSNEQDFKTTMVRLIQQCIAEKEPTPYARASRCKKQCESNGPWLATSPRGPDTPWPTMTACTAEEAGISAAVEPPPPGAFYAARSRLPPGPWYPLWCALR